MSPLRPLAYCALASLLFLTGCSKSKSTPTEAAKRFLQQVADGQTDAAYQSASFFFQAQESQKSFAGTARELGLVGASQFELTPLENDAKTAKLNASITSAKGKKLQFVVTMNDESNDWRMYSIRTPRDTQTGLSKNEFSLVGKSVAFNDAFAQPMPPDKTISRIVRDSMILFSEAIRQRSFKEFYDNVSLAWQADLTLKQLQRAFQNYIDNDVNMSGVADLEPVFDAPPQMTSDGLLIVSGHYPSQPMQVVFNLKFIYELPNWKLFGVSVDLRKAPAQKAKPAGAPGATPSAPKAEPAAAQ
jgi:hypothetical protein